LLFVNYIFYLFPLLFLFESYTYLKLCIVIDLILLAVDFDAIFMVSSFCMIEENILVHVEHLYIWSNFE